MHYPFNSKLVQSWSRVGPELVQSGSRVGPELVHQSWSIRVGPKEGVGEVEGERGEKSF